MTRENLWVLAALFLCLWTGLLARFKGYSALCWFVAGGPIGIVFLLSLPANPNKQSRIRANSLGLLISLFSLTGILLLQHFL
jgi:hypothetical protein